MLDRTSPPPFHSIQAFDLQEVGESRLSNGLSVFHLNAGSQGIFKIEILLRAGSWYADNYAHVPLALKMLNQSTLQRSSNEMANALDALGAFIEFTPGFDFSSINLYGLSKYFVPLIKLLEELLTKPAFKTEEFEVLKKKEIQKLALKLEKTSYVSSTKLRGSVFGTSHPYGKFFNSDEITQVCLEDIEAFHRECFNNFDIVLSGALPSGFINDLDRILGHLILKKETAPDDIHPVQTDSHEIRIAKDDALQSSIKIGKNLFNRSHQDYIKLQVVNEILGGYFGSRLMKNIREEKGLTYGIYSHVYTFRYGGYFVIGTDVKKEFTNQAIDEIYKEINKLNSEAVPEKELEVVKNYMLGNFVSSIDSPFSLVDKFKAIHYQGLGYDFYQSFFDTVNTISPKEIMHISQKYLQPDSLINCIVGAKD